MSAMTVKELRDRLAFEPDEAIVEVYREDIAPDYRDDGPAVLGVTGFDSYGYGPSGSGAVALTVAAEPEHYT